MKILCIFYSQTGQLTKILENMLSSFKGHDLDVIELQAINPYPFPWTAHSFFNEMPETVLEKPIALKKINFKHTSYDLVIMGYQPWFLSPSPPVTSLLDDSNFKSLIKDTDIITVIGARNMWINAQKSIHTKLNNAGAKLIANIPLIDTNNNYVSAITILYWMLSGKKKRLLGIFPEPGIPANEMLKAATAGHIIHEGLQKKSFESLQQKIVKELQINIPSSILFIEKRAKRIFLIWAKLIHSKKAKTRKALIVLFQYYLFFALFIVAPILLTVYKLIFYPFLFKRIKKEKQKILNIK